MMWLVPWRPPLGGYLFDPGAAAGPGSRDVQTQGHLRAALLESHVGLQAHHCPAGITTRSHRILPLSPLYGWGS